jgi:hypothetical protein
MEDLSLKNKISCEWVHCSEVPLSGFVTLVFRGGHPEPCEPAFYLDGKWTRISDYKELTIFNDSCWLRYKHSDYSHVKF